MSDPETNIHVLDAAYKPFPTFAEWASRTSVDTVRWDRYMAALRSGASSSAEALNRAYEVVKRAAALDTGAIEGLYEVDRGFTYSVAFETAAWEVELAKKGENVRPLFEAQLHAYDYVLDLATKAEQITEAAIRVLHEVVCRAQATHRVITAVGPQEQELIRGRYKVLSNHVRTRDGKDHSYAPVDVTPAEMQRLVEELRTDEFLEAHPVLQAAYAHYGLAVIHPFPDGNGRVARALASVFTYRAISMPIMILSDHKSSYLDALEEADLGEYQAFVDFMLDRSVDTLALVHEAKQAAEAPTPEGAAAAIEKLYFTKGGYTQDQVEDAGQKLLDLIHAELLKTISKVDGPYLQGKLSKLDKVAASASPDSMHRWPVIKERGLHVEFNSPPPALAKVYRQYALWLPRNAGGDDDIQFSLVGRGNNQQALSTKGEIVLTSRMDELVPSISGVLYIRLSLFADRIVGEALAAIKPFAEKSLRGQP